MVGEWTSFRLGDVCSKIGSGATPRGGSSVYLDHGDIALIRSQNVYNDSLHHDGITYLTKAHAVELANVEVAEHDVLLNITGDSVARSCQVDADVLPARVNQHVAIIRPDPSVLWPRFLRYFLVSPAMQAEMLSLAGAGATRNALTKGMIESFEVLAPRSIHEQRAIANILGTLDDRIDLNRRMSKTLEATAQTLFESWFAEAIQDGLPAGWKIERLGDVANVSWGDTNTTKASYSAQGFAAYSASGRDGCLSYHDFDRTGVIVSAIGANAGASWLALGKWSCIKNTIRFWATAEDVSTEYLFYATRGKNKWPLRGSAQPFIAQGDARAMEVIVPANELARRFGEITQPIHVKINANQEESRTLAALRDALLPNLLSGEIRLKGLKLPEDISDLVPMTK